MIEKIIVSNLADTELSITIYCGENYGYFFGMVDNNDDLNIIVAIVQV